MDFIREAYYHRVTDSAADSIKEAFTEYAGAAPKSVKEESKNFQTNLGDFLNSIRKFLMRIREKANNLNAKHKYKLFEKHAYNNEANMSLPVKTHSSFSLKTKVNFNKSFVQVPIEVYNQNVPLLNDIVWSEGLNNVFINNLKKIPGISWQYVGLTTGAWRMYPGRLASQE